MKKLILTAGLFLGLNQLSHAQNAVTLKIGEDICIETLEVLYSNKSTEKLEADCTGEYTFDAGKLEPEALIINGVVCKEGTTVLAASGHKIYSALTKVIQVDQQKLDGVLGLIR